MINLKDYREYPQKYIKGAADKGHTIDRDLFDNLDTQVRELKFFIDESNAKRNTLSKQIQTLQKWSPAFLEAVQHVKTLKQDIATKEKTYEELYTKFKAILLSIPSPALSDVPVGTEEDNHVIKHIWQKPSFDFAPKTHWELLEAKWYLDTERGVKLSWSRFVIVKGKLAELQLALTQWATKKLIAKWFELTLVPQLVKEDAMTVTWYLPDAENGVYVINPWEDDYYLIWTSEVPLIAQHANETFDVDELPRRYVWYSSCFRREAWSYGKDTKWLIRLHQFEKVEMVSFVTPEDAEKEHELLFAIENEIFTELWLHYQQILIASGDLWAPAAKKYDIEAWFPGIGAYKEVTSTSNTTDFQTRRGAIKYKDGTHKDFVCSLNGTAVALWRALACIVETYQTKEGDICIPEVLQAYMGVEMI